MTGLVVVVVVLGLGLVLPVPVSAQPSLFSYSGFPRLNGDSDLAKVDTTTCAALTSKFVVGALPVPRWHPEYRFATFADLIHPQETPSPSDISLVSITSADPERVKALLASATRWQGPVSIALHVCNDMLALDEVMELIQSNPAAQRWLHLHLVVGDTQGLFPFNVLRNVAIENMPTGWLFIVDADAEVHGTMGKTRGAVEAGIRAAFDDGVRADQLMFIVQAFALRAPKKDRNGNGNGNGNGNWNKHQPSSRGFKTFKAPPPPPERTHPINSAPVYGPPPAEGIWVPRPVPNQPNSERSFGGGRRLQAVRGGLPSAFQRPAPASTTGGGSVSSGGMPLLRHYAESGKLMFSHEDRWVHGYKGRSSLQEWMGATSTYAYGNYTFMFEPYVIMKRPERLFPEEITGIGYDKILWEVEMAASGKVLYVIPETFALDAKPHQPSKSAEAKSQADMRCKLLVVVCDTAARHNLVERCLQCPSNGLCPLCGTVKKLITMYFGSNPDSGWFTSKCRQCPGTLPEPFSLATACAAIGSSVDRWWHDGRYYGTCDDTPSPIKISLSKAFNQLIADAN